MSPQKILFFFLFLFFFSACRYDPFQVDSSSTEISISFIHLDSLLFHTPTDQLPALRHRLSASISELFDYQIGYCMRIGRVSDTAFVNSLVQYRSDSFIVQLEKEIATKFSDLSTEKDQLIEAFRKLKTHLPNIPIPEHIVFQNSLFNSSAFCTEKEIGIGLDQYLGVESPCIQALPAEPFHEWIKASFNRQYLERDALMSWILTHVVSEMKGNLAQKMIDYGKAIYLTEAALPMLEKHLIMRYSKENLTWAQENEHLFWKYLIDEKMLFKNNERDAQNMLSEGPFTPGLPEKAPDRLGQYMGWKIVKNYMIQTRKKIHELIDVPYNEILQSYKN